MKSWSVSRRALALALVGALMGSLSGAAQAADVRDGFECLGATDLPCAREVVNTLRQDRDPSPELDLLEARVLFHEGDFPKASGLLTQVLPNAADIDLRKLAGELPRPKASEEETSPTELLAAERPTPKQLFKQGLEEEAKFYADTAEVHRELVETRVGDIIVVHHRGVERLLVMETVDALMAAKERIAPRLGGDIPMPVRVEFYPDVQSFTTASGLPVEAIKTTGVVAISKWNRLLISSPRVRGGGYGWKDTVVHEWIHMVVSYHAADKAPIWLQEGIAKSMDSLWREDVFELPVRSQSLIAGALRDDEWVTFKQMHPSMAFLPSADMAGLAYAQVATMVQRLELTVPDDAIPRVLTRVRNGMDARDAFAAVANGGDFDAFEADWRAWLGTLKLLGAPISAMPTNLEGEADAFDGDPVLARRKDLANLTRLGELMAERGHMDAALSYYRKATPDDEPPGPLLVLRTAQALNKMGRPVEAIAALELNQRYYPEVAANRKLLGELLLAAGQDTAALQQFSVSSDVNPFDLSVQRNLTELYAAAGDKERAARHLKYQEILNYRDEG